MNKYIILMRGLTATGKSTTAKKLSKLNGWDLHSSALLRIDMGLSQGKNNQFKYDLNDPLFVKKISPKVYNAMINRAEFSLKKKNFVILDAAYNFYWQRKAVYDFANKNNISVIILKCRCDDEGEIKKRLKNREKYPLKYNEATEWKTYLSTKNYSEKIENDYEVKNNLVGVIEYDTHKNNILSFKNITKEVFNLIKIGISKKKVKKKKNKIVVAIDFDGVITHPHKIKADILRERGFNIKDTETERSYCTTKLQIPKKEYEFATNKANVEDIMKLPLERGAKKSIDNLNKKGVEFIVVTSRFDNEIPAVINYIKHHKLKIKKIINVNYSTKTEVIKKISPHFFIEDIDTKLNDVIKDLESQKDKYPGKIKYLFFRNKANKHMKLPKKAIEVNNWETIERVINSI